MVSILLEQQSRNSHHDDSHKRARYLLAEFWSDGDDNHTNDTHDRAPDVSGREVGDVAYPLVDEVGRHRVDAQSEEVLYLGGEDSYSDTTRKTNDNRVGYVLDDSSEFQQTEEYQEYTCHNGGNGKPLKPILLNDAVDDDDEGTGRAAYLHLAATEQRDDESGNDSRDDALLGCYARGDTKSDGKWQGYNAHNDTSHEVAHECLFVIRLQCRE